VLLPAVGDALSTFLEERNIRIDAQRILCTMMEMSFPECSLAAI
jgi:hypothetical protein